MEAIIDLLTENPGILIVFICVTFIGIVAQLMLYAKCKQPSVAAIVPIWNIFVFLNIIGRPKSHIWLMFIPIYGQFYIIPKMMTELARSFGKTSTTDFVMIILFNGFYVLNLGLSFNEKYLGPVYGKNTMSGEPQLA